MNVVIVGHGSSVLDLDDGLIDSFDFVVRLKDKPQTAGAKTDAISSTSKHHYKYKDIEYWLFHENDYGFRQADYQKWMDYYLSFNPSYHKPSNGTIAAFMAKEFLGVDKITLAGFDMMKSESPDKLGKERYWWAHDQEAERQALENLFKEVVLL